MGTRSTVGMKTEDGKYQAIYVHYDGYPEHMLRHLPKNYDGVVNLIESGDGSVVFNGAIDRTASGYSDNPEKFETEYGWHSSMKKSWCEWYYCWDEEKNDWTYGRL